MNSTYRILMACATFSIVSLIAEDKQVVIASPTAAKVTPVEQKGGVSTLVNAAKGSELKLEIWDEYAVMGTSINGKDEQVRMEALQKDAANDLEQRRQASAKRLEEFNVKKDTLSKEAREKEEQELIALSRELQNEVQKAQERIRHELNKATEELARSAEAAAIEIAKRDGVDLLIEKNTGRIVCNKESYDITNQVTNLMDEKHKTRLAQNKKASSTGSTAVTVSTPNVVGQKAA